MIRAKIVIKGMGGIKKDSYEADLLGYQSAILQTFNSNGNETHQVPGVIVRLDSGEIKVQPLQLYSHTVEVFQLTPPSSKFIYPKRLLHSFLEVVIGFGIGALVMLTIL